MIRTVFIATGTTLALAMSAAALHGQTPQKTTNSAVYTAAQAERAARAYKDINRLGLKLLRPGGLLFTFSCSGGIGPELFHKIVAGAAIDAGVDGAILQRLEGACDHPTTLVTCAAPPASAATVKPPV